MALQSTKHLWILLQIEGIKKLRQKQNLMQNQKQISEKRWLPDRICFERPCFGDRTGRAGAAKGASAFDDSSGGVVSVVESPHALMRGMGGGPNLKIHEWEPRAHFPVIGLDCHARRCRRSLLDRRCYSTLCRWVFQKNTPTTFFLHEILPNFAQIRALGSNTM